MKKILKITGIITLIISYGLMILNFILDNPNSENVQLFNVAWIFGIISFFSNVIYAIKTDVADWIFSLMGFCGLIWFVPFWVSTAFGIPSMVGFLIIGIYVHLRTQSNAKKTA